MLLNLLLACRLTKPAADFATAASGEVDTAADTAVQDTSTTQDSAPACTATLLWPMDDATVATGDVTFAVDGAATLEVATTDGAAPQTAPTGEDGLVTTTLAAGDWTWHVEGCDEVRTVRVRGPVEGASLVVSDADVRDRVPHVERVVAHLMGWFGTSGHIDVGYRSDDPATAARQVADARSRGIRGFVYDGYGGLSPFLENAFREVLAAADASNVGSEERFEVAYMYDYGALRWGAPDPHDSASVTAHMIAELRAIHAEHLAAGAPHADAWMRWEGRPLLFTYAYDDVAAPDLAQVRATLDALHPAPLLIDRDPDPFHAPWVDGWYGWINFEARTGEPYANWWYATVLPDTARLAVGVAWPGFDDSLASWGGGRVQPKRCGRQLDDTLRWAEEGVLAHGGRLPFLQIATWNDIEEGSDIEGGVDGCITTMASVVTGSLADNVTWTVDDPEAWVSDVRVLRRVDPTRWVDVARVPVTEGSVTVPVASPDAHTYLVVAQAPALMRNGLAVASSR